MASISARLVWPYTSGSRCPSRLRLGPLSTAIRIQRFRFCSQDWNWSKSSFPGSGAVWCVGGRASAGAPKKSSNDTPASFAAGPGVARSHWEAFLRPPDRSGLRATPALELEVRRPVGRWPSREQCLEEDHELNAAGLAGTIGRLRARRPVPRWLSTSAPWLRAAIIVLDSSPLGLR